jgi:hypothetical protein
MVAGHSQDEGIHGPPPGGGHHTGPQQGSPFVAARSSGGHGRAEGEVSNHCSPLPKLSFPKFSGENPRIWIDKCSDYIKIFSIPECIWTTATLLHMEDNAARWLQVYKMQKGLGDWPSFVTVVEDRFWAYDYRQAIQELLSIRQEGSVEDYTREFEAVQFQVSMFHIGFDEMFFTAQYVNGLKDEVRFAMQTQWFICTACPVLLCRTVTRYSSVPSGRSCSGLWILLWSPAWLTTHSQWPVKVSKPVSRVVFAMLCSCCSC